MSWHFGSSTLTKKICLYVSSSNSSGTTIYCMNIDFIGRFSSGGLSTTTVVGSWSCSDNTSYDIASFGFNGISFRCSSIGIAIVPDFGVYLSNGTLSGLDLSSGIVVGKWSHFFGMDSSRPYVCVSR